MRAQGFRRAWLIADHLRRFEDGAGIILSEALLHQWLSRTKKVGVMPKKDAEQPWAIVLAGGDGTRLQSLTCKIEGDSRPKQFSKIFGSRSSARSHAGTPTTSILRRSNNVRRYEGPRQFLHSGTGRRRSFTCTGATCESRHWRGDHCGVATGLEPRTRCYQSDCFHQTTTIRMTRRLRRQFNRESKLALNTIDRSF